ncbi:MAG: ADP-ribosylglycohydrolase family protein [Methylotenera sp.]|nr:ADP-ribosylglycohydrolase family protein [Methylotenera sp.]MDO9232821.1 ADP-ribosylglycohydrolase family protein [Methylotenera sp.]MDP2101943.1 ADP-ribosylglycohydrolase family protein [Methylotenera sp.]MDP2280535.1 ADP-ribosylglycohydrolase family protein [Methylotenera sp.]MDP2404511.1 ADP-ribosylglycohydrolase family protein [Methylotenera sp.]
MNANQLNKADRMRGALWGMFVGDALAMPVHWYYNIAALWQDFGQIRDYQAPKAHHPNSIMALANTSKAGRGTQEGDIVGNVILKGKKQHWGQANRHYHQGMHAGDNTLNLLCARVLLGSLNTVGHYDSADFLREYIGFMTEPDRHNDTYAESYHRDFFANYAKGVTPDNCAGTEGHDTASMGGLVSLPLVILAALRDGDLATTNEAALRQQRLTHRSSLLERHSLQLSILLFHIFHDVNPNSEQLACAAASRLSFPAAEVIESVRRNQSSDLEVIGGLLSPACYIDQSFPSVLYLAARYPNDFEAALIANTNVGGDNCHRGAVLGAILGASLGFEAIPKRWINGLTSHVELNDEIEKFITNFE